MNFLKNLICGACIGIAEAIPGVSGGTVAVLLKIYDELIGSISKLRKEFKKSILFLIPIVLGMGLGLFGFSHVITYLLENFPMAVNYFFVGLIVGLVPMLLRRSLDGGFRVSSFWPFLVMLGVMAALAFLPGESAESAGLITEMDVPTGIRFFFCGIIAAVCMILPGISGSMMMVIFGVYDSVIKAVSTLNIPVLIPVGLGALVGILFGAKLVDFFLRRFPQATYFGILGLVLGSLFSLFQKAGFDFASPQGAAAIFTLAAGVAISLFFTKEPEGQADKLKA